MANIYVYSGAAGAGTGADWANAYTTLKAAAEAAGTSAGDDIWVAHDHAETHATATLVITFKGTLAAPNRVICVNRAGSVPPNTADLLTTATWSNTGANSATFTGCIYCYGITFLSGDSGAQTLQLGGTTHSDMRYEACSFQLMGTTTPILIIGSTSNAIGTRVIFDNSTYKVGNAACTIQFNHGARFEWYNTADIISGATIPTALFGAGNGQGCIAIVEGCGLQTLSTKTLVAAQSKNAVFFFKDCRLPASITVSAAPTSPSAEINLNRCSSAAITYINEKHDARGDQTTETTIVRTGGLLLDGTNVAMKIIATANAKPYAPFVATTLLALNTATAANVTVTVYGIWSGGALPNNNEVWMEVEYLGNSSYPLGTINTGTLTNVLAAAAAQATDSSVWGGSTTPFKLVATLSAPQPGLTGVFYVKVKSASTNTVYIDPTPVLS